MARNAKGGKIELLSDHDALPPRIRKIYCEAPHSYSASSWDYGMSEGELLAMIDDHARKLCAKTYGKKHPCYERLGKTTRGFSLW